MNNDERIDDVVLLLSDFAIQGDLEQIAQQGVAIYDAEGEMAAEAYFEPIMGDYNDVRAIIRPLKAYPATPDDVAGGF